jgi:hypothetical protein
MSSRAGATRSMPAPAETGLGPPRGPKPGGLRLPLLGILVLCVLGWAVLSLSATPSPGVFAAPAATPTPTLPPDMGAITGAAWSDANGDGLRDPEELPLPGATISLYDQAGLFILAETTDLNGSYTLAPLSQGVYRVVASGPAGYRPTTDVEVDVYVSPGPPLVLAGFGFQLVPSPTPTATRVPMLDIESAQFATCGGLIQADTQAGSRNVDRYGCKPAWDETGPELVYRIELGRSQLLSATFLTTTVDLDLFLLPSAYPETCLQAGDNYVSQQVEPGVYFLAVDGYRDAVGSFTLQLDCPLAPQATPTTTHTPTATPTVTQTPTPGPTATLTPTRPPLLAYLPMVLRVPPTFIPGTVTFSFQQGIDGYDGTSDTTLNSWEPERSFGGDALVRLRYNRSGGGTTEMAPIIRFDLAMLPRSAVVVSATLRSYAETKSNSNDLQAELRGLLKSWDESSATWEQAAEGRPWAVPGAQGVDQDMMAWWDDRQVILDAGAWYSFDATDLVQLWVEDPASNHGAILLARAGENNANVETAFASCNASSPGKRPQLSVAYWVPSAATGQ